ncbi:hypothetical protein NQ314_001363 [Rhamnusium bicolor]|uniref:Uncharacterized protein n=1 Tax=Rhamnusium bicolor TaxID=1586634 RepID=A0AAV8ZSR2_9CUCU|nr:hypothetical protein NQ314_001363 [Rhamnusium bicolor]
MDNGRFNKYGMVIAFSPAMRGDLTKMSTLKELSEVCEKEIGEKHYENCEGAKMVVECVARNGKAYGIEFPHPKNM